MPSSGPPQPGPGEQRTLGVVGTMVWDRIHDRHHGDTPVEEWGGISYGLQALVASLPEEWRVIPFVKVGEDLAEEALRFLRAIPRLQVDEGVMIVPHPNNRVELRYVDDARRTERLHGGVPPWNWTELADGVRGCDALYVNFISGFEMALDTALALRVGYDGPIYADLHSLFLGIGAQGDRYPRELPGWGAWLRCFDAVQMNEDEFDLLGRAWGDPWHLAAGIVSPALKLIAVTLGERGAAYVAGPDFTNDPLTWPGTRDRMATPGPARTGQVATARAPGAGDPTGCGDVWGATLYARLLAGDELEGAMDHANRMAVRNLRHKGAYGLHQHLAGRLAGGPGR